MVAVYSFMAGYLCPLLHAMKSSKSQAMKHGLYLLLWLYDKPINNTEYGDIAYGLFLIPTK